MLQTRFKISLDCPFKGNQWTDITFDAAYFLRDIALKVIEIPQKGYWGHVHSLEVCFTNDERFISDFWC
jgi:hypothetical protein